MREIEPLEAATATRTHVVFDEATGRVLGRIRHRAAEDCDHDEQLASFARSESEHPALLESESAAEITGATHQVTGDRVVLAKPQLVLDPERDSLEGDGEDTIAVAIVAVKPNGKVAGLGAPLQVTTTRGKLSSKRGYVDLKRGKAVVSLTATRETVEQVVLTVRSLDGSARAGSAAVRFE